MSSKPAETDWPLKGQGVVWCMACLALLSGCGNLSKPWPPLEVSADELSPQTVSKVTVPLDRRQGLPAGTTMLKVHVNAEGRPVQVRMVGSSGNTALDRTAQEVAWQTTFKPYEVNGQPVPVTALYPVRFNERAGSAR